jgi:tetratricopeptide (TPR) repeat protein
MFSTLNPDAHRTTFDVFGAFAMPTQPAGLANRITPMNAALRNASVLRCAALACLLVALGVAAAATPPRIEADDQVQLTATRVEWMLDGPFALRRVELLIRNPHDRPLETTVQVPLAGNERLRGYALDIEGKLRDAVPVERVRAHAAFEETVRNRVDPALAQKDAGNRYGIRVFPIPAHGERRLQLDIASLAAREACGWRHRLDAGLPLGSQPTSRVTATTKPVAAGTTLPGWHAAQSVHAASWQPAAAKPAPSACLAAPTADASFHARFEDGLEMHWLEVPARRPVAVRAPPATRRIEVVWDASYSTLGIDRTPELQLLDAYLRGRTVDVTVSVLRETVQRRQLRIDSANSLAKLLSTLADERPDGATALPAWRADPRARRVLLFSDGVATLPGAVDPATRAPVFVIAQGVADPTLARWITHSGGQILDLATLTPDQALRALRRTPTLQATLGPLDRNWYLEQYAVDDGALRACHVARAAGAAPRLSVIHATASGPREQAHRALPARNSALAEFWCATWQAEALEAQPDQHRAALAALGERFGVANRETSLLVLESDDDYVRFGILPPAADVALRDRIQRRRAQLETEKSTAWMENRRAIQRGWEARTAWWNTVFPKEDPRPRWAEQRRQTEAQRAREEAEMARERRPAPSRLVGATAAMAADAAAAPASMPTPPPPPAPAPSEPDTQTGAIGIQLQAVTMDSPYVAELRAAHAAAALYHRYLDLRTQYGQSPAFHFDVAQRLFELGDAERGWRVLSNLVELMPNDPASLRLVAYRLQEAGLQETAIALLRKLRELAPDEPQSFRDLALALRAPATCAEALALLDHVVDAPWSPRFADIGVIALAERNDLRTRCPAATITTAGDLLAQPLPVGLRAVLRWDLDDTDIDLHVTDPNGEEVYYSHRLSYQGGTISRDFTAGYGPEEFILRNPKPGIYEVAVNYYGSRLAKLTRGATLKLSLQTGFGTSGAHEQTVNLRLLEQTGKIVVGRFIVHADGALGLTQAGSGKTSP